MQVDYRNEHIVWFQSGRTYLNADVDGIRRCSLMGIHDYEEIRSWCESRGIPLEVGVSGDSEAARAAA